MAWLSRRRAGSLAAVAAAAGAVLALVLAGRGDEPPPPATTRAEQPARPASLVAIRPRDRRLCRASRLLRPICPRRVPAAFYPRRGAYLAPHGRVGERYDRFDLIAPPRRHLALFGSRYGLDRVFSRGQRRLGRVTWAGVRGELVLDASSARAGEHLVFRWSVRGVDYAVALAATRPRRNAVATLRAVVSSARPRRPRPRSRSRSRGRPRRCRGSR